MGKKAILDFINYFQEQDLHILEKYFEDNVRISRMDYSISTNRSLPIEDEKICDFLNNISDYQDYAISRGEDTLYISIWK